MPTRDDALLASCGAPRDELARHYSSALGWPYVDPGDLYISCGVLRRVSAELCCRLRCVPFIFNQRRAVLLVDDPADAAYIAANPELLGQRRPPSLAFALTSRWGLDRELGRRMTLVRG